MKKEKELRDKKEKKLKKEKKKFIEPELSVYDNLDNITFFTQSANVSGTTFF